MIVRIPLDCFSPKIALIKIEHIAGDLIVEGVYEKDAEREINEQGEEQKQGNAPVNSIRSRCYHTILCAWTHGALFDAFFEFLSLENALHKDSRSVNKVGIQFAGWN